MSKVIDIEDAIIMSRMFQYGWDEEYKKKFEKALSEALEIKSFDLEEHDSELLDKVAEKLKDNMCSCSFKGTELCDVNKCGYELEIDIIHETIDEVIAELKAEVSE